jgi:hypothetical protein
MVEELLRVGRAVDLQVVADERHDRPAHLVQRAAIVDRAHDIALRHELIGERAVLFRDEAFDQRHGFDPAPTRPA